MGALAAGEFAWATGSWSCGVGLSHLDFVGLGLVGLSKDFPKSWLTIGVDGFFLRMHNLIS